MTDLVSRIGLAEVLRELRNELGEAQARGADSTMRFEIQEAELEFAVEISKEAKPGAKIKIDVVAIGGFEVGGDATIGNSSTHRITLKLSVIDERTGQRMKVAEDRHGSWGE